MLSNYGSGESGGLLFVQNRQCDRQTSSLARHFPARKSNDLCFGLETAITPPRNGPCRADPPDTPPSSGPALMPFARARALSHMASVMEARREAHAAPLGLQGRVSAACGVRQGGSLSPPWRAAPLPVRPGRETLEKRKEVPYGLERTDPTSEGLSPKIAAAFGLT